MMLTRLAQHYYRPEFTEGQAKLLIADYIEDLAEFEVEDVDSAVRAYRRDAEEKYFPTIGQLRKNAMEALKERNARHTMRRRPEFGETRPHSWWAQPKTLWKPDWRESEVPPGHKIRDVRGGALRDPA